MRSAYRRAWERTLLEDLCGRTAIAEKAAMKPTLTTVLLIILDLSCGVQVNAQDSKTEPLPSSLTMVYAPAWSGQARSGVSISVNPGVYVLDSRLGKVSFCETEVDQPGAGRKITLRCSDWFSLPPH
jgi:hypothetical protein